MITLPVVFAIGNSAVRLPLLVSEDAFHQNEIYSRRESECSDQNVSR